jgi:hypothetical protein
MYNLSSVPFMFPLLDVSLKVIIDFRFVTNMTPANLI